MPGERRALDARRPAAVPWWRRALPLGALALVVVLAVTALGHSDAQVRASTTREPQPFLELGLTRSPDDVCGPRRVVLRFALTSHYPTAQTLDVAVAAEPVPAGRGEVRRRTVTMQPEGTVSLTDRLPAPRGEYDVVVSVADHPERLRIHCDGGDAR